MAEDGAKQRTDGGRPVSAALVGAGLQLAKLRAKRGGRTPASLAVCVLPLSPPRACLGPGTWFCKLTFLIRHQRSHAEGNTGLAWRGQGAWGLGQRVNKGNPTGGTLKQGSQVTGDMYVDQ